MYLTLLLIAFTAIFISSYLFSKLFFNNRGAALLLLIAVWLYFLPTLAAAFGLLRPWFLLALTLITLLISVVTYIILAKSHDKLIASDTIQITYGARPIVLEILTIGVPAAGALIWIGIFTLQSVRHEIAHIYIPPFPWDVIEYHFPNLLNAIQDGSLWIDLWAHYPMGAEMFHAWGFLFLKNDALVYPMHFFFSIFFIFFSCLVLKILCFQENQSFSGTAIIVYLLIIIMLLLAPPLWDMHFNQIGKNDMAMSAFIMAALYFLLLWLTQTSQNTTFAPNIFFMGIALGIASGIKPHGVLYAIFFLGLLFKNSFGKQAPKHFLGGVALTIIILAGIWYLRPFIMLTAMPPSGIDQTIIYHLQKKGIYLFLQGRENLLFSLVILFWVIMWVIRPKNDLRMRTVLYALTASIIIFCLTPYSVFNNTDIQLRLAPAIIPLVVIISLATFWRYLAPAGGSHQVYRVETANSGSYRRAVIWAGIAIGLFSLALVAVSFFGPLAAKPRWAWNLRGLIVVGFLAASLWIYQPVQARKDFRLSWSRDLLAKIALISVSLGLAIQITTYTPPGDLVGYNEQTAAYRWVYRNIRGQTLGVFGLRPYGLYGRELANRVIYGGYSGDTTWVQFLSLIKKGKPDYLVVGRDFVQHPGWYDFAPFPRDLAQVLSRTDFFTLVWSDSHAMIFKIDPRCYSSPAPCHPEG